MAERIVYEAPPPQWLERLADAWGDTLTRSELAVPGSLVHLWDTVALFVAVALLEHWGVTALAWPNDEDHTLGWLADAP